MLLPEILRWSAVAAVAAIAFRLPRPTTFWSLGAGRPLVLARLRPDGPRRFRQSAPA